MSTSSDEVIGISDLLEPQPFKRENWNSHLYVNRSSKLNRRVYLYGHFNHDLWTILETDSDITDYNERVRPVPLIVNKNHAKNLAPSFVSLNNSKSLTVHIQVKEPKLGEGGSLEDAWSQFCNFHGYTLKQWSDSDLPVDSIERANLKKILSFTTTISVVSDKNLQDLIMERLRLERKMTLHALIRDLAVPDPELVKIEIFRLILEGRIFSDIKLYPLSTRTELSAFHEFA